MVVSRSNARQVLPYACREGFTATKRIKNIPWDALGQAEANVERMYTSVSLLGVLRPRLTIGGPLKAIPRASWVLEVKASSRPGVAASAA